MRLVIIRHGETDWNLEKKVQGSDSSRLTEKGLSQASKIKKYFDDELSF